MVSHERVSQEVRGKAIADDARVDSWLKGWLASTDMQIGIRERMEAARWRCGARTVVVGRFEMMKETFRWPQPAMICNFEEVMVFVSRSRRVVCLIKKWCVARARCEVS
jgi:hypothetical protein